MRPLLSKYMSTPRCDEDGQTIVEYALVVAFVSIAAMAVLQLMTGSIVGVFNTLSVAL